MSSLPFSEKFNNKNKNFSFKENEINFQYNLSQPIRRNLRRSNAVNLNTSNYDNNYGYNMQRLFNTSQSIKKSRPTLKRSNAVNLNANNYGNNMQRLFNLQQQNAVIANENAILASKLSENANQLIDGTQADGPLNNYRNNQKNNLEKITKGGKKTSRSKSKSKKH